MEMLLLKGSLIASRVLVCGDESFDGNAAILKGSLIASRLVVHERRWGDQQNALLID